MYMPDEIDLGKAGELSEVCEDFIGGEMKDIPHEAGGRQVVCEFELGSEHEDSELVGRLYHETLGDTGVVTLDTDEKKMLGLEDATHYLAREVEVDAPNEFMVQIRGGGSAVDLNLDMQHNFDF